MKHPNKKGTVKHTRLVKNVQRVNFPMILYRILQNLLRRGHGTDLVQLTQKGLIKRKNIYIKSPFLTLPQAHILLIILTFTFCYFCFCFLFQFFFVSFKQLTQFWIHFCLSYFFYSNVLMAWSIILYFCRLFVIFLFSFFFGSFLLFIYSFITANYWQFISIYYLINHYLLSCSLIALKIYLVHTIISIFYYG